MSRWTWLPTSVSEKSEVFGEFNKCLAFELPTQAMATDPSCPTSSLPTTQNGRTLNSENDVFMYLNDFENRQPDVSILAFTNLTLEMNGKLPLPISRALFEHIIQVFNLSSTFLTVLTTGVAIYTSTVQAKGRENGRGLENDEFILQQNRAYSAFSMAIKWSLKTGRTRVLVFGVESASLADLFAYLRSMPPGALLPTVVPALAMELRAQGLNLTMKDCQSRIRSIERATGMRQLNYPHERNGTRAQDWRSLDLIPITRDLSSFLSRFAFLKLQAETGAYLVQQMVRTTKFLIERIDKDEIGHELDDQYDLVLKLEHIESWYLGIAARCRYLSERTLAQSQTVYCLIASQDNATNIEIARASKNIAEESHRESEAMRAIAELSRRDNMLMIQVAKDSRMVAVAAAQDSAAMQVIAAVTILFLPATFTATFFSMTFFDFLSKDSPRISPWSWIYVLITVVLTVIIQLAWVVISKKKKARITQATSNLAL